ncbi:MAG: hypothetical protein ACRD2G_07060 [Terriglobia bacterium]
MPYFVAVVLSIIGLVIILRRETPDERGLDKLLPFGRLFFAVPMAVFGAQHFTATVSIARMIPPWIPGHLFWTYLVGTCLIAAALSIVVKKCADLAATLLGIMLILFVVLMHFPNLIAHPSRFTLTIVLRELSFSGGALAFAGTQTAQWRERGEHIFITFGRFLIGIAAVFFGVENLLHPGFVPGVPLDRVTPAWIPGHLFWSYLAGVVLIGSGLGILLNKKARLAALCMGIMVLLLVLFVYLPIMAAVPFDIANGLNYFADTLLFSGSALLLAQALTQEVAEIVVVSSVS